MRLRCLLASDTSGYELFYETANKHSADIQEGAFPNQMVNCKLHKKDCTP